MNSGQALARFRISLGIFVFGLILSGVTAFPLLAEMRLVTSFLGVGEATSPEEHSGILYWLLAVRFGLEDVYAKYPWMAYGTDWLAFGHIVIAFLFVHPLLRPAESRPVLIAGIAACIAVIPLAFVCGAIRGIPIYWRLIDCAFGIFGSIPLIYCLRLLPHMRSMEKTER
jgi:hypothetical protein